MSTATRARVQVTTISQLFARDKAGKAIKLRLGSKPVTSRPRQVPMATLRYLDLDRYVTDRYGPVLPDDDAGREDAMIMLNHIAHKQASDRQWLMHDWLDRRAPWLIGDQRAAFIRKVFAHPIRYTADTLAERLGLTWARRKRLGITTIWAIDRTRAEHAEICKAEKRERQRQARVAAGAVSRLEYETGSLSEMEPWKAEGTSRASWYRHQKQRKPHYAAHGLVSHIARVQVSVTFR